MLKTILILALFSVAPFLLNAAQTDSTPAQIRAAQRDARKAAREKKDAEKREAAKIKQSPEEIAQKKFEEAFIKYQELLADEKILLEQPAMTTMAYYHNLTYAIQSPDWPIIIPYDIEWTIKMVKNLGKILDYKRRVDSNNEEIEVKIKIPKCAKEVEQLNADNERIRTILTKNRKDIEKALSEQKKPSKEQLDRRDKLLEQKEKERKDAEKKAKRERKK